MPPRRKDAGRKRSILLVLNILLAIYIGRIQELYPALDNLFIGKIMVGICLLLYLGMSDKPSWKTITAVPQVKIIKYLIAIALISAPFSVWPGASFDFIGQFLFKNGVLFLLIVLILQSRDDIVTFCWGLVLTAIILSGKTLMLEKVGRLSVSNTYDSNDLAFVMILLLPLVYFLSRHEYGIRRLLLYATMAAMLLTVIHTGSRGGFIGLVVVTLATIVVERQSPFKIVLIGGIVAVTVLCVAPETFWTRMEQATDQTDYNFAAESGRIAVWKRGMTMMVENPLLGVGIGNFSTAEGLSHAGAGKWSTAHNSFIQLGAETGIIGLILFLRLLAASFRTLNDFRRNGDDSLFPAWLADALLVSFTGYLVAGFFLSQAYTALLYVLIALTVVAATTLPGQNSSFLPVKEKRR